MALTLPHGYVLGKKGTTKYDMARLAQIISEFIDDCLDSSKENVLAAFEKMAK